MQGTYSVQIRSIAWLGFVGTVLVSAYRVFNTMLNHDVGGFLLDARAFELGRKLYESFFEMNMPSNVWLPRLSVEVARVARLPLADVHLAILFLFVLVCAADAVVDMACRGAASSGDADRCIDAGAGGTPAYPA